MRGTIAAQLFRKCTSVSYMHSFYTLRCDFFVYTPTCIQRQMWLQIPRSRYQYTADCWQGLVRVVIAGGMGKFSLPDNVSCCETMWQKICTSAMSQQCFFAPLHSPQGAHPKPTSNIAYVAGGWLILGRKELYGAGSLANKHFTICSVYSSTLLSWSRIHQTANAVGSNAPLCVLHTWWFYC